MEDRLLRVNGVAEVLGVCKSTIWNLVKDGRFPKPKKINNAAVWKMSDIQTYIKEL